MTVSSTSIYVHRLCVSESNPYFAHGKISYIQGRIYVCISNSCMDKPEKNYFQQKSSTSSTNNRKVVFEKEFAHVESDLTQNVVTKSRALMYIHMNWKKKCTGMSESSTHC